MLGLCFSAFAVLEQARSSSARIEVLEGRVRCATSDAVRQFRGPERAAELSGPVYVEAAPMARLRIAWASDLSCAIAGAATLEWSPPQAIGGAWRLHVLACETLELEVRRGAVELELPGGHRADLERGAICVREIARDVYELRHDAGLPLLLSRVLDEHTIRPPLTVLPGARMRLECTDKSPSPCEGSEHRVIDRFGRGELAIEKERPRERWAHFSWPWPAQLADAAR